jgi:hypothetical protein
MSHHGNNPEMQKAMSEAMKQVFGEYPDGKLNAQDEGGIAIAVATENGRVILRFPKPVAWIGFTADEAAELAMLIMRHARKVGLTKPVTFEL